ncbi:hypothetical protein LTR28_009903 [Elasticomyces elasticus]|nr:hypothetical protein LTR28_009903 [Elasticomyces elasticus]
MPKHTSMASDATTIRPILLGTHTLENIVSLKTPRLPTSCVLVSPTSPSPTSPNRWNYGNDLLRKQCAFLLAHFPSIETLRISCNGDPAWPGLTKVEELLVTIRITIEKAKLSNLREIRLAPMHAMGIMHFRWHGLGAYGETNSCSGTLWQNLTILELQVLNPFTRGRLGKSQRLTFRKVLHDYLRSFRQSLKVLRFAWMGEQGPNPLCLDLESSRATWSAAPLQWDVLEEIWVGRIAIDVRMAGLLQSRARRATKLMVLAKACWHDTGTIDFEETNRWRDLSTDMRSAFSALSRTTLGNVSEADTEDWDEAFSRTSREVPFMLDL